MSNLTINQLEKILKALANRRRLKIIIYLNKVESASVSQIAQEINATFTATSKHLRLLKSADVVDCEQVRFQNYYRLVFPHSSLVKVILTQAG